MIERSITDWISDLTTWVQQKVDGGATVSALDLFFQMVRSTYEKEVLITRETEYLVDRYTSIMRVG